MICRTCPATLGARNRSGHCRACSARHLNSDPTIIARREANRSAYFADPAVKAAYRKRLGKFMATMSAEEMERRREHGRRQARDYLQRPEILAVSTSPEVRARAGASRTATCLAWCPADLRPAYKDMTKRGIRAPVARAAIKQQIAARQRMTMSADDAAAFLRRLSPVYRCDANGRQNTGGSHWRRGSAVLDRDALIVLALEKGWQPDAWARIAA